MRPSALQKLVKKYDGSGDPFDHIAAFKQAIHAEQVSDTHTKIEGFGLSLESKALTWFQTLDFSSKTSFERLEKDFIASFSKMGLKHNAVALIYSFQQKDHESVRDSVSRLRQYVNRCPEEEKPSQGRLISVFLTGLRNKLLQDHLYARKHATFQECCLDAMDYDDNFEGSGTLGIVTKGRSHDSGSSVSSVVTQEKFPSKGEIADELLQRLGQAYKPLNRYQNYAPQPGGGYYRCGKCGGPHRTDQCDAIPEPFKQTPVKKWCQLCQWNYTHETKDCNRIGRTPPVPEGRVL